ncbi:hypothetical protein BJ978_002022 [Agromyces terreus]|uniref:Glycerophosphoryl diester phosphodiesterase membrane domain-containing protein n=1 Tax=Agromyces terreus TaxID=424795 RepID=A0A9X2H1A7_9MICO|nr:hypothetical protein [Agromyces terreus]MCP2371346.1 hypothetical protein [Agromyces terreus]
MSEHDWQAPGASTPQPPAPAPVPQWGPPTSGEPGAPQPQYGAAPPGYGAPPAPYGAPIGWTPPPKPGLLPLRPMGFGTLLWAPFRTLRRNPAATFGSGLIVQLVALVVTSAVMVPAFLFVFGRLDSAQPDDLDALLPGSIGVLVLAMLVAVAVSVVAGAFLQGVMIEEVASGTLGQKLGLGALWRRTLPRIGPLLGWTALVSLAVLIVIALLTGIVVLGATISPIGLAIGIIVVVIASLGLAVLGFWLGTRVSLVPSIIVLERAGIAAAVRRSWRLTTGFFWRTLGIIVLVGVLLNIASQIVLQPISLVGGLLPAIVDPTGSGAAIPITIVLAVVTLLVTLVIGSITTVVQAAVIGIVYIDLRMRSEGLDLELQRHVEQRDAGLPVGDPWAAPAPDGGAPA